MILLFAALLGLAAPAAVLAAPPQASAAADALSQLRSSSGIPAEAPPARPAARTLKSPPGPVTAPNACYAKALAELKLTAFGAVSLCSGTASAEAPVACFRQAVAADLSPTGAVLLCSGAASTQAPAACYRQALKENLTALGAVTLCHAAQSVETPIACFRRALNENLTAHGAVQLCGGIPFDLHKQVYGDRRGLSAPLAEAPGLAAVDVLVR